MNMWARFFLSLIFITPLISSCMLEYSGMPVGEYERVYGVKDRESSEKLKEIQSMVAQMSKVKENSVFTEKRGFPEYKVGPGDILLITFWSTAVGSAQTFEGFRQINYELEVRPDGKISYMYGNDIPVAGLTTGEIYDLLMNQIKSISVSHAWRSRLRSTKVNLPPSLGRSIPYLTASQVPVAMP